jgi:D-alanyl-D-alanine carboxypeptidase
LEEFPSKVTLQSLVTVSPLAVSLNGTKANLLSYDQLTVENLLFGMMLPSGNDAAQMLGIFFGEIILTSDRWKNAQRVSAATQFPNIYN